MGFALVGTKLKHEHWCSFDSEALRKRHIAKPKLLAISTKRTYQHNSKPLTLAKQSSITKS